MNFVDNLSLHSGLKVSQPSINPCFFPIVAEKYITLHTEDHQSKQWDHLQEFINLIKPYLKKENIKLVELGWNKEPLSNIDVSTKNLDPKNAAYILEKSLLHIGVENFLTQLASFYDVPCVSLYSNTSPDSYSPLWGEVEKYKKWCIEPDLKGNKPSYSGQENPKSINTIPAEKVAGRCLDILNIEHDFDSIEVIHIGEAFHATCLEALPDFIPDPSFYPQSVVNLRMDYHFDESPLIQFANNRKISIVSDKPVNLGLLRQVAPAIQALFFKVNENFDFEYLKQARSLGRPLSLILQLDADPSLTRNKFFDLKIEAEEAKVKKDLDNASKICNNTRYKSSKMIWSKGKKYSSKAALLEDIPTHEDQKIIDTPDFWAESQYVKLYNIDDKENSKT